MKLAIYTDGAYSPVRDKGGIGVVFVKDGELYYQYKKSFTNTTNNKCEIMAVVYALKAISTSIDSCTIYTDSQYVFGCATLGWKRKKNPEYWELFDKMLAKAQGHCPNITFKWVKGHSSGSDFDSRMNNLADKLAVEASQEL